MFSLKSSPEVFPSEISRVSMSSELRNVHIIVSYWEYLGLELCLLCTWKVGGESPVIIPYKVINRIFITLYGIITGSLSAYDSWARHRFTVYLYCRRECSGENYMSVNLWITYTGLPTYEKGITTSISVSWKFHLSYANQFAFVQLHFVCDLQCMWF